LVSHQELFIGIDGGQSSTTVLIADSSGRVLGSGRNGPCNHVSSAEAAGKFSRVIGACVAEACESAQLDPQSVHFVAAHCGMSGGVEDKAELLRGIVRAQHYSFSTDGEIALTGALGGAKGIVVIAGTGSIAFGRNDTGKLVRAGGWGYIFGDEGSAFDIVRQAVRAALRSEQGWGTPTGLTRALLDAAGAQTVNQILHLFYTPDWPRARVASLAPLVDQLASSGDAVARGILEHGAQQLAALAASVRAQLFTDNENVPVAYVGGVFRSGLLLERFRLIVELTEGCRATAPLLDPAAGALIEAFRAAGRQVMLSNVPPLK
jgi:N-acetylglucosamine kinase